MKHILFALVITSTFISCKNHSPNSNAPGQDTGIVANAADSTGADADSSHTFFPVADFIGGQVKMVDSLQLPISKYITVNRKTTPLPATDAEFRALAAAFRQPDINDPALRKFYKESSYADQSIPSIVFSYTTTDPMPEIRKIDVIISPDPAKNDKVKTIYMEKQRESGDTIIRQKLYWKVNHNFMIVTEKQVGKTLLPAQQVKMVWDPTE